MSDRSSDLIKALHVSQEKFDYFILSMTAALFAYIGAKYEPEPLSLSENTLELAALGLLIVSIIAGFKRLETGIDVQSFNAKNIDLNEERGALIEAINKPGTQYNRRTGDIVDKEEAALKAEWIKSILPELNSKMSKSNVWTGITYRLRNWSLVLGFILLLAAKVFGTYSV